MFLLTYVSRELRRRLSRTVLTALGLAAGVGLVIGIIGVSQGLNDAQGKVLAPLRSVGTDILVTRVAGAQASPTPSPSASAPSGDGGRGAFRGGGFFGGGGGGGGFFGGGAGGPGGADLLNQQDAAALLNENNNVITDLSKLGKPGTKFTHDFFLSATLLSFPQSAVDQVAALPGVASATAGLTQLVEHESGTVPQIVAQVQTGGQSVTTTVRPAPLTNAERASVQACLEKNGGFGNGGFGGGGNGGGGNGGANGGPGDGGRRDAFEKCLPERFKQYRATVITPLRTIQQVVDPPSTDISNTSYTAAGIDPAKPDVGLVTRAQLTQGAWLSGANDVLANAAYANKRSLKVGSTIDIDGTTFTVVGVVSPTLTGSTADLYFPLQTLQRLASKSGRVTQVLVQASDAASVDRVAQEIKTMLPGAEVVTTKSLAAQVTGSLTDAKNLASRLGGALGIIVLAAAFVIAVLLTLSSIAKRVREIGTLRAIGWSKARVVRQIVSETIAIGVLGGALGIGLGYIAAVAVGVFSPPLTATSAGVPGLAGSSFSGLFGGAIQSSTTTAKLSLSAPVHPATLALGIGFAVLGGLLAGAVGGLRAARLSPAEALRNVG